MPRVAIIGGCRTPFVKAGGQFRHASMLDMGLHVVKSAVRRLALDPQKIDELAFGTVLLNPRIPNAAREIILRSELPKKIGAHFISNNCITGLSAASFICDGISSGRIRSGLAGGSESMSQPALTFKPKAERFFLSLARARSAGERLKLLLKYRPNFGFPVPPSPKEPSTGLTMGQHCELMVKEFKIPRELQDQIAFQSHQTAARAQVDGELALEIEPFLGISHDNLIRKDTTLEKLAKLQPVFDRSTAGTITAGSSSALTDGASVISLMSDDEARKQGKEIIGYIEAIEFAGIAPQDGLLMAPAMAVPRLLERCRIALKDVDIFEIHEAFGGQVACNLDVWEKGWTKFPELKAVGKITIPNMNLNGGSIAIGHPFAATGGRLILSACNQLKKSGKRRALISVCAAGAMAAAALITRP